MTWPVSRTAAGSSTTWSRSNCGPSPGLTYPLVAPGYKPDAAAGVITDGLTPKDVGKPYLRSFPYLGVPYGGYYFPS